jgi:hypothetical protein
LFHKCTVASGNVGNVAPAVMYKSMCSTNENSGRPDEGYEWSGG